jgi:hypothetical protein
VRRRCLLAVGLGLLSAAGAAGASGAKSTTAGAAGPCRAAQTKAVVYAFAQAWTRGDLHAANRLVAPEPQFRWVTFGPPGARGTAAFNRRSLTAYIARRHAQQDRLRVTIFKFRGSDVRGGHGYGHFEFDAERQAADWPSGVAHERRGKGAIVCTLRRPMIAVWSLG